MADSTQLILSGALPASTRSQQSLSALAKAWSKAKGGAFVVGVTDWKASLTNENTRRSYVFSLIEFFDWWERTKGRVPLPTDVTEKDAAAYTEWLRFQRVPTEGTNVTPAGESLDEYRLAKDPERALDLAIYQIVKIKPGAHHNEIRTKVAKDHKAEDQLRALESKDTYALDVRLACLTERNLLRRTPTIEQIRADKNDVNAAHVGFNYRADPEIFSYFLDGHTSHMGERRAGTVATRLSALMSFWSFMATQLDGKFPNIWVGLFKESIRQATSQRLTNRQLTIPNEALFDAILATTSGWTLQDVRDRAILLLLRDMGPRAHEVTLLRREDVEYGGSPYINFHGSDGTARRLPVPQAVYGSIVALWQKLEEIAAQGESTFSKTGVVSRAKILLEPDAPLFPSVSRWGCNSLARRGEEDNPKVPITRQAIAMMLRRRAIAAGISPENPELQRVHTNGFRHLFAERAKAAGMPLSHVRVVLGLKGIASAATFLEEQDPGGLCIDRYLPPVTQATPFSGPASAPLTTRRQYPSLPAPTTRVAASGAPSAAQPSTAQAPSRQPRSAIPVSTLPQPPSTRKPPKEPFVVPDRLEVEGFPDTTKPKRIEVTMPEAGLAQASMRKPERAPDIRVMSAMAGGEFEHTTSTDRDSGPPVHEHSGTTDEGFRTGITIPGVGKGGITVHDEPKAPKAPRKIVPREERMVAIGDVGTQKREVGLGEPNYAYQQNWGDEGDRNVVVKAKRFDDDLLPTTLIGTHSRLPWWTGPSRKLDPSMPVMSPDQALGEKGPFGDVMLDLHVVWLGWSHGSAPKTEGVTAAMALIAWVDQALTVTEQLSQYALENSIRFMPFTANSAVINKAGKILEEGNLDPAGVPYLPTDYRQHRDDRVVEWFVENAHDYRTTIAIGEGGQRKRTHKKGDKIAIQTRQQRILDDRPPIPAFYYSPDPILDLAPDDRKELLDWILALSGQPPIDSTPRYNGVSREQIALLISSFCSYDAIVNERRDPHMKEEIARGDEDAMANEQLLKESLVNTQKKITDMVAQYTGGRVRNFDFVASRKQITRAARIARMKLRKIEEGEPEPPPDVAEADGHGSLLQDVYMRFVGELFGAKAENDDILRLFALCSRSAPLAGFKDLFRVDRSRQTIVHTPEFVKEFTKETHMHSECVARRIARELFELRKNAPEEVRLAQADIDAVLASGIEIRINMLRGKLTAAFMRGADPKEIKSIEDEIADASTPLTEAQARLKKAKAGVRYLERTDEMANWVRTMSIYRIPCAPVLEDELRRRVGKEFYDSPVPLYSAWERHIKEMTKQEAEEGKAMVKAIAEKAGIDPDRLIRYEPEKGDAGMVFFPSLTEDEAEDFRDAAEEYAEENAPEQGNDEVQVEEVFADLMGGLDEDGGQKGARGRVFQKGPKRPEDVDPAHAPGPVRHIKPNPPICYTPNAKVFKFIPSPIVMLFCLHA